MRRSIRAAFLWFFVQATQAVALDPEQAGREARDGLRELLDKQRSDREAQQARPTSDPPKPASRRQPQRTPTDAIGGDLPAVCIGCDAR